jgi:voltage-gated potassium channel
VLRARPELPLRERVQARAETAFFLRRLVRLAIVIVLVLAAGTAALAVVETVSPWHAFVMAVDTVATVGALPEPRDTGGQVITVLLIVFGVGTLFYALVTTAEFFVAGHLGGLLVERRMQKLTDALSDHYIVCGFGRVGREVARDLAASGARFVIVDERAENRDYIEDVRVRFIEASPSDDRSLHAAGIERARGIVACVDSDAENIFITLTARELRPDITIIARASAEESEKKLRRAGADRIVSPYKTSGQAMARLVLHPQVTGAVDVAPAYRLEEIEISGGCAAAGSRLEDVRGDAFVVAIRRADGSFHVQPPGETVLAPGDVLVAMGRLETIDRLTALFEPNAARSAEG